MTGFAPIETPPEIASARPRSPAAWADKELMRAAPVLVRLADVEPEPIRWLWPGRIALGKLTLLAGDPGLGKSFITLDTAARVSTGTPWPDARSEIGAAGGVVLLSAEDDVADTIRPRLDAVGADVSRIAALEAVSHHDLETGEDVRTPFCLATDLPALEAAIERTGDCRLLVIDPITAYLGRTDSHRNAELRGLLAPLADLAGRCGVAVLAVTHLNKNAGGPALYRSMGSLAFTAAARAVWAVAQDRDDPHRRLMLPVKNNLAADVLGLAFSIEPGADGAPIVAWEPDPVELTADQVLAADRASADDGDDAESWLREALSAGELPAVDVLREGQDNGYSAKAIRKAFKTIKAHRRREGFGRGGTWHWSLLHPIGGIDAHAQETGNNANNGDPDDGWGEL